MQLPSLNFILTKSSSTLKRFPLAIASAILAAFTAIYLSDLNYSQTKDAEYLYNLIMVSVLGISLFFAIKLVGEKKGWSTTVNIAAHSLGLGLLAIYFFLLPDDFDSAPGEFIFRYILYFLATHLLVAIGPFWNRGEMSGFWQYNKTLFLRFLTAVLFSAVLFIGLSIALGSIDVLLGVDIDGQRYFQLFLLIAGIFNTWFFLAGIPESIENLNRVEDYPKGLKIFTQNILIPLIIIYVVILYLYTGKILLEWTWPEGWVAYLVLSFSIAGIFALLLLHPIQEKVENRWIKKFSRSYFWTLVPLVILLLLAIWVRIDEYGITINRYFVLILGLWLGGIVTYFITSQTKNIKVIPASLCIISFMISFGPWGAFSVAEQSQVNRLEQYLQQNEIIKEGVIQKTAEPVSFEDRTEISSILRYLNDTHGLNSLQPWFEEDLSSLTNPVANADSTRDVRRSEMPGEIAGLLGIEYVEQWQSSPDDIPLRQFTSGQQEIRSLDGYEWFVTYRYSQSNSSVQEIELGSHSLFIQTEPEQTLLKLYTDANQSDTLRIDISPMIEALDKSYNVSNSYNIPSEEMTVNASNEQIRASLYLSSLNIQRQNEGVKLRNFNGELLLRINN